MEDQLQSLTQDQAWQSLKVAAGKGVVPGFGRLANDLVESCITGLAQTHCCMQYRSALEQLPFASVQSACCSFTAMSATETAAVSKKVNACCNGCGECTRRAALPRLSAGKGSHTLQLPQNRPAWHCGTRCAGYDDEARYFEASVRQAKRAELLQEVLSTVGSAFHQQLRHLHAAGLQAFQTGMQAALQADPAGFSNAVHE